MEHGGCDAGWECTRLMQISVTSEKSCPSTDISSTRKCLDTVVAQMTDMATSHPTEAEALVVADTVEVAVSEVEVETEEAAAAAVETRWVN